MSMHKLKGLQSHTHWNFNNEILSSSYIMGILISLNNNNNNNNNEEKENMAKK